jgi:hypothetical protein
MATATPYDKLTEAELRAAVLDRPDRRLPPPAETKALIDEWIKRRSERVARA